MGDFAWIAEAEEFTGAALTVRVQTITPDDDGQLLWDAFMPRLDVNSIHLRDITVPIHRPATDRREWNQQGRQITRVTPEMREMKMVPTEGVDRIDEEEMQELVRAVDPGTQQFRDLLGLSIPDRLNAIALANFRRVELDVFEAWSQGQLTQTDPQTGVQYVSSYGFDVARYLTAATAWNDVGTNAFDELIAFLQAGRDITGRDPAGVMLRTPTLNAILADAPQGINAVELTVRETEQRVADKLGSAFRFYLNERTVHRYTDGGTAVTQVKVWPAQHVAFVPQGEVVGRTAFAPVVRAKALASQVPDAEIDVRGNTAHLSTANEGKELRMSVQLNQMPVPDENLMYVTDAGV